MLTRREGLSMIGLSKERGRTTSHQVYTELKGRSLRIWITVYQEEVGLNNKLGLDREHQVVNSIRKSILASGNLHNLIKSQSYCKHLR